MSPSWLKWKARPAHFNGYKPDFRNCTSSCWPSTSLRFFEEPPMKTFKISPLLLPPLLCLVALGGLVAFVVHDAYGS